MHQACHTVHSGVPAADHGCCPPLPGFPECHLTALHFLCHRRSQKCLPRELLFYQIHIDGVSDDHLTGFHRPHGPDRHFLISARPDSYDIYFLFHSSVSPSFFVPSRNMVVNSGSYSFDRSYPVFFPPSSTSPTTISAVFVTWFALAVSASVSTVHR